VRRAIVTCLLVAVVAAPAALATDPAPTDFKNAAKYCKALRQSKGVEAFNTQYGTNANKKNAFGKCVSSTNKTKAKAANKDDEKADDAAEAKATANCKKQQAADASKFAATYKNLGQCVKALKESDD
jgi:hypothetical protein